MAEAIAEGAIAELAGYSNVRREVAFGEEGSRVDLLLESPQREPCYVEVKNVTAAANRGVALFPDCVSERGSRHLRELIRLKARGLRPVQVYCVQRGDVDEVRPADGIDYEYGRTLREAIAAGVEVLAYRATGHAGGDPDRETDPGGLSPRITRRRRPGLSLATPFGAFAPDSSTTIAVPSSFHEATASRRISTSVSNWSGCAATSGSMWS